MNRARRGMSRGMRIAGLTGMASALLLGMNSRADDLQLDFHGAGWTQFGRIEHSFTPPSLASNNYNSNWIEYAGGLISATAKIDSNWEGAMGLGALQVHLARGSINNANIWYPFLVPFVAEARITYSHDLFSANDQLRLTAGTFPYTYNPDVKNLGFYLLRGYVYPGILQSGFEIPFNITGGMARYQSGDFRNDLILKSETDDYPLYDFSLADVINYQVAPGLELGAGVNFYRLIPQNSKVTSPPTNCLTGDLGPYAELGQADPCGIIDTVNGVKDTVGGSLAGTKLMGRFHLDPKAWFENADGGPWGKNDWVIYGEAAIIGLKDYPKVYNNILRRIPVMVGFDFPTWDLLDYFSLEVEYYADKNSSDEITAENGSWVPAVHPGYNYARDDWKWSFNLAKVFLGHVKLSAQVADDHTRLGGYHDAATGVEVFSTPTDWYWMGKLAFFF